MLQGCDGMAAISMRAPVIAVMQQDNIATFDPLQAINQSFGGLGLPVPA
jgi:hypothetical protein